MSNDCKFCKHPLYDRYEANSEGIVRNVRNKRDLGQLDNTGYLQINITVKGNQKLHKKHRFIYECFNGEIENKKLVVDHINNIKTDNRLENLQLITQSENLKRRNFKQEKKIPIPVRAINLKTEKSFDYPSLSKCGKDLGIIHTSIWRVLKGIQKTATSKLDGDKYYFERI